MIGWLIPLFGLVALWLLGAAGNYRVEQRFPPTGTFIEVDGVKLHYLDAGSGAPVVLIHGASGNLLDFKASIFDRLAQSRRVIAFDRPGLGYSELPDGPWCGPDCQARLIHDALDKLDIRQPVIVGHSWGGAVAMAYGLAYPEETGGVVDLSGATHPFRRNISWYNQLAGWPVLGPAFRHLVVAPFGTFLASGIIAKTFSPDKAPADFQSAAAIDLIFRPGSFAANAENSRNLGDFLATQYKRYPEFRPPLIILTGAEDDIVPPANHARKLKAQLPEAELIELAGVGHMPHYAAPDRVIDAILRLSAR